MKANLLLRISLIGLILISLLRPSAVNGQSENAQAFYDFLKDNKDKFSLSLIRNGDVLIEHRADTVMPLASTVKIILAIEYAYQAAASKIDPEEMIPVNEIDRFYAPYTDGNAHVNWKSNLGDKIQDGKVSLREIASGMIMFSSNANTEWLGAKLGYENVNKRAKDLGLSSHTEIYPIVSALYVGKELFSELDNSNRHKELVGLSVKDYLSACYAIHDSLMNAKDDNYKNDLGDLAFNIQRVWSDRLPAANTKDYSLLMADILNNNFPDQVQYHIEDILGFLIQHPAISNTFTRMGFKGGTTSWVLTEAIYAEDKDGNKTAFAMFINDIEAMVNMKIHSQFFEFNLDILNNEKFLNKLIQMLK